VITTDGKGIVMRNEHLRETRKAAEQAEVRRRGRPMKRLARERSPGVSAWRK
jgi:hypothetical protein